MQCCTAGRSQQKSMTAMLYSGQKSVTGKKLMKLTEKFYSPEAPGPLSRWAAGPLDRWAAIGPSPPKR